VQQQGGVVDGGKPQSRNPNPPKVVAVGGTGEDSRIRIMEGSSGSVPSHLMITTGLASTGYMTSTGRSRL